MNSLKSQPNSETINNKRLNLQKRYSISKGIGNKTQGDRRGASRDILQSHTTQATDPILENNFITEASHRSESSGAPGQPPSMGVWQREEELLPPPPPEHLLWRPAGPKRRSSTGLREAEMSLLEPAHKVSGQKQWLRRSLGQDLPPGLWGSPLGAADGCGSLWGWGHGGGGTGGIFISLSSPGGPGFGNKA